MKEKLSKYEKRAFLGITLTALGVVFTTTLSDQVGSLGAVFIAVGGLFLISAMAHKKKEEGSETPKELPQ